MTLAKHKGVLGWQLVWLTAQRRRFRLRRAFARFLSPRRVIATGIAFLLFALLTINCAAAFFMREPADPENLRLWLSGGMVLYAIYHCVRCAWGESVSGLELTPAEELWIEGAPLSRNSIVAYRIRGLIVPTFFKSLLFAAILARDVEHIELLMFGIFASMWLLEIIRIMIAEWTHGLGRRHRAWFRVATFLIAGAVVGFVVTRTLCVTPRDAPIWEYGSNLFRSVGEVASSNSIQWLSLPWIAPAHLSVAATYQSLTLLQIVVTIGTMASVSPLLIRIASWRKCQAMARERHIEPIGRSGNHTGTRSNVAQGGADSNSRFHRPGKILDFVDGMKPGRLRDIATVVARQSVTFKRYRTSIAFTFVVSVLVALTPLLTDRSLNAWMFVVTINGFLTIMIAPAALRRDFRRDISRMMLLRSLPIHPTSLVIGTLAWPVLITCASQWLSIAIAACIVAPPLGQIIRWTCMLNAIAVFAFAFENTLFLLFPYQERGEGVSMLIRAKMMLAGKTILSSVGIALLCGWVFVVNSITSTWNNELYTVGVIVGAWTIALAVLMSTARCWERFDVTLDTPLR